MIVFMQNSMIVFAIRKWLCCDVNDCVAFKIRCILASNTIIYIWTQSFLDCEHNHWILHEHNHGSLYELMVTALTPLQSLEIIRRKLPYCWAVLTTFLFQILGGSLNSLVLGEGNKFCFWLSCFELSLLNASGFFVHFRGLLLLF